MEGIDKGKAKVVSLVPTARNEMISGENVILRLEEALALARAGRVQNVVVIMATDEETIKDGWANSDRPFDIIGALEVTKLEFIKAAVERRPCEH